MDETILKDKLNGLVKEFKKKPNSANPQNRKLTKLAEQARVRKKLKENTLSPEECLDLLLVYIKYQLFDIEATRRENAYLRKILKDKNK